MQLELHMDVIDDFVGEAREVPTSLRAFASAPLPCPRLHPLPRPRLVGDEACSSPVLPSARPLDPDPPPRLRGHIHINTRIHICTPPQAYRVNRWLTYGEPLQRLREFGVTMKEVGRTLPSFASPTPMHIPHRTTPHKTLLH